MLKKTIQDKNNIVHKKTFDEQTNLKTFSTKVKIIFSISKVSALVLGQMASFCAVLISISLCV
jgi:hypothetical protein